MLLLLASTIYAVSLECPLKHKMSQIKLPETKTPEIMSEFYLNF